MNDQLRDDEFDRRLREATRRLAGGPASAGLRARIAAIPREQPGPVSGRRHFGLSVRFVGATAALLVLAVVAALLWGTLPHLNWVVPGASPTVQPSVEPSASPSPAGTSSARSVIPWLDAPVAVPPWPTPVPATPPPGLMPCLARDLQAQVSGWGGAAGTTYFRVRITNASATACYLQGTPDAQVLDGQGRVILDGAKGAGVSPSPPFVSPGNAVAVLSPGTSTEIDIGWSDWCGPAISGPISFALLLPREGGRLVAAWAPGVPPLDRAVTCMGGSSSVVFAAGPFEPAATSVPATPEPTPLPLQIVIGQGQGIVAATGTLLRFTITLTNSSHAPLDLRSFADGTACPAYEELIVGATAPLKAVAFTLNCASAGPVAPGASVTFAMQMPTAGVPAGDYVLSWALAPQKLGPAGKTSLTLR